MLGSGKNLAPPTPHKQPVRSSGLLSPSSSSISLSSQTSSTPLSNTNEDIASRAALEEHGSIQAASASQRMVCPICNEEMMTLLQLNRHIDDNHANLEEVQQIEAKSWFQNQMKKAKKFQPLAVLNQKLRGLETFESNDERRTTAVEAPLQQNPTANQTQHVVETQQDPDEVVTRAHWQRPAMYDSCSDPLCGKRLGGPNGQVNCRHCGKLFCEEHTMYQMKLSRSAQHEPVRGLWCRVCETCYKSRPGYNDHTGFERDHFNFFKNVRTKTVDKTNLEIGRLEGRLTRLTQLLANPPPEPAQSASDFLWSSISGAKPHLRALEQSIVSWEDDAVVSQCPFCQQAFSQYTFRRHHCRVCGRVVCSDPATACSAEISLDVATQEKGGKVPVEVRMCKDCQRTVFSKADFERELATQPPDQRAFERLVQFEAGIRLLLPRFQRLLLALQDPERPPAPAQLTEATKTRKRLTDAFTQLEAAARRIRDLPAANPTQHKLQQAVFQRCLSFLHTHMLPLKSIPKILKHATPNGVRPALSPNGRPSQGALASIKYNDNDRPDSSRASSNSSAQITALEAEEKELRERMIVLEEQRFFVSGMIADANKRRKFDEVSALSGNVADLSREIDQIQGQLAQMDFASSYLSDDTIK